MDSESSSIFSFVHTFFFLLFLISPCMACQPTLRSYIVQVKQPEGLVLSGPEEFRQWHSSLLGSTASSALPRLVHSYDIVMNGFAARLTMEELDAISKADWFVYAYPNRVHSLETTRTPGFLGLDSGQGLWNLTNFGKGIIVGLIDTGIMPNHASFDDVGMPPPPAKWQGSCGFEPYMCNKKLIGARSFVRKDTAPFGEAMYESPMDATGHGTFTASVVAGNLVLNVSSATRHAQGTAAGIAPLAHIAVYKVCGRNSCEDDAILQGINAAIRDGVDILSISIGTPEEPFYVDPVTIGTYSAVQKGIFVSKSAGNLGPKPSTLTGSAPWLLTVGASSLDRSFTATVKLGNGMVFNGESLYEYAWFGSQMLPLVYPGLTGDQDAMTCADERMGGVDVTGKLVLCEGGNFVRQNYSSNVERAGGVGMILMNDETYGATTVARDHVIPSLHIGHLAGLKIKAYMKSTKNPTATIIFEGTVMRRIRAPRVASFSSRGPSRVNPGILKPDIIGPGVGILGAKLSSDPRNPAFKIESGTSVACPHLSGVAALLKSVHPDWSPAMIRSAIMTTADVLDNTGKPILDERNLPARYLAMGAGHVNPTKASDPGLVYDIKPGDYHRYICGLGYETSMSDSIVKCSTQCSTCESILAQHELNYPSIVVSFTSTTNVITIERTVTNVGGARSIYWLDVKLPKGVSVDTKPKKLVFDKLNQERKFTMTFTYILDGNESNTRQGRLKWVSAKHVVRSPILINFSYLHH